MANIVIDDIEVPMMGLTFHYVKNGTCEPKVLLSEALRASHEDGDGTGKVYSLDEYRLEKLTFHIEARICTLMEPVQNYPFSGDAATRYLSKANGCLHKTTFTDLQENYPEHGTTTKLTSCDQCLVLVKHVSSKLDELGAEVSVEYPVGAEVLCDYDFFVIKNPITSSETIMVNGVQVPLVYEKYAAATNDPYELPVIFDTAQEAEKYTLAEGDGSMVFMVSKLYQSLGTTVSYEVEVTEHAGVNGEPSADAYSRYMVKEDQRSCVHLKTADTNHMLYDDTTTVEYVTTVCMDCDKELTEVYFVDSCQRGYSDQLMTRTPEQASCAHYETKLKPTPEGYLGCLNVDTSVSVYCAHCDAMLHTLVTVEEDNLLNSKSMIAASYAW
jgi:hypothetical protein